MLLIIFFGIMSWVINLKEDILISDILKEVDRAILKLDVYYTLKNSHKNQEKA